MFKAFNVTVDTRLLDQILTVLELLDVITVRNTRVSDISLRCRLLLEILCEEFLKLVDNGEFCEKHGSTGVLLPRTHLLSHEARVVLTERTVASAKFRCYYGQERVPQVHAFG